MMLSRSFGLTALCSLAFISAVASAQEAPVPSVAPGTQITAAPAGSVPIKREGAPETKATTMQAVGGSAVNNEVLTAATPRALDEEGLPSLENAKAGNLAGLASYCVRDHLVHGTTLRVIGRALSERSDVKADQFYSLGGKGLLQTGSTSPFDVSTLDKAHRTKLCAKITERAKSFR